MAEWLSAAGAADARADGLRRATMRLAMASRDANREIGCEIAGLYLGDATESDAAQALDACVRAARGVLKKADALRREVEKMDGAGYGGR